MFYFVLLYACCSTVVNIFLIFKSQDDTQAYDSWVTYANKLEEQLEKIRKILETKPGDK